MSNTGSDATKYLGEKERYWSYEEQFQAALQNPDERDPAALVALAVRAGLAEIASVLDSVRGFGLNQASGFKRE